VALPQAALPPPVPAKERRRSETSRARDQVRAVISRIEANLAPAEGGDEQVMEQCRKRLEALDSLAVVHQPELADELAGIHRLERRIATLELEARSAAREAALTSAAWQRRIAEIERLVGDRSYPEARRLAEGLAAEAGAPPEVVTRARELSAQADRELKRIFSAGRFGTESHQAPGKPPS
jgi:hypothetical protein